ncbi:DUF6191 domain-containing protein [Streptomyces sp. NBC_01546]|uniref:DUF6191 domain-containing protein n=1 Tax=Streptomyces sp. NBC_01546 TaxID=2975872 RepID=UPI003869979F
MRRDIDLPVLRLPVRILFALAGWRRRRHGDGGASTAEAWAELFHPSRRHVQQERERQLVLRDDAESGAPPALLTSTPARRLSAPCRAPRAGTTRRNGSLHHHAPVHDCQEVLGFLQPRASAKSCPVNDPLAGAEADVRCATCSPIRLGRGCAGGRCRAWRHGRRLP